MKSLLYLSYKQTDISFYNLQTIYNHEVYHDIYDRVVEEVRKDIKKALQHHRTKLIIRTIYILKAKGAIPMLEEICGDLETCNISLWRIAMVYSVVTIKRFRTKEERLDDIIENIDMILPRNDPHIAKVYNCINKIINTDDPDDLNLYINTYMAFGNRLKY